MNIKTLFERSLKGKGLLTPELLALYGGDLVFFQESAHNRPYVLANFVQSIDGIVSYKIPGQSGGGPISCNNAVDLFIMGLLRSVSDAVLIGSGTFRDTTGGVRIPLDVYPEAKGLYAKLREKLGKPPSPLKVILTGSGNVDLSDPAFHTDGVKVVILTTDKGASRLALQPSSKLGNTIVRSTGELDSTTPAKVLAILFEEFGVGLLVHEGGPTVFGQFLEAGLIDTLFLTVAPQIIGRSESAKRPGLAGSTFFMPKTAPLMKLSGLKISSGYLFLRYERN